MSQKDQVVLCGFQQQNQDQKQILDQDRKDFCMFSNLSWSHTVLCVFLFCFVLFLFFLPLDVFKWKSTDILLDHQKVKVAQSLFETLRTIQSMEFSRLEYWSGQPFPSPGGLPNPQIEPRSPTLQEDSLPAEPQGKPKNPGVGTLSCLQQVFPTQESNQGLLHCRWTLYQLSYQGSPRSPAGLSKLSHTRYLLCVLKVEYSRTQTI